MEAYLLNAPSIVKTLANAAGSSLTGTVAETQSAAVTIPANTLGATGCLRVTGIMTGTGTAGTKSVRVKFGGTTCYAVANASTVLSHSFSFVIFNKTTATQVALAVGAAVGYGASNTTSVTGSIDTTADVTLQFTSQLGNSGDTMVLDRYLVEVIK